MGNELTKGWTTTWPVSTTFKILRGRERQRRRQRRLCQRQHYMYMECWMVGEASIFFFEIPVQFYGIRPWNSIKKGQFYTIFISFYTYLCSNITLSIKSTSKRLEYLEETLLFTSFTIHNNPSLFILYITHLTTFTGQWPKCQSPTSPTNET